MTAKLEAVLGNIVDQKVEILVTAANAELLISAGAYGYPRAEAAAIAVKTLREEAKASTTVKLVRIVAFEQATLDVLRAVP